MVDQQSLQLAKVNSQLEEQLANLRVQLAEVVDEVQFCDGEIAKFKSQGDSLRESCQFLVQSLSNSYVASTNAILTLRNHVQIVEDYLDDKSIEETKESRDLVESALAELDSFKRQQVNAIHNQGLVLPESTIISSLSAERSASIARASRAGKHLFSRRPSTASEGEHEISAANRALQHRIEMLEQTLASTRMELERTKHESQAGNPTSNDSTLDNGMFGMSSNSQVRSFHGSDSQLENALQLQRQDFEQQKQAILKQTEIEIQQAENENRHLKEKLLEMSRHSSRAVESEGGWSASDGTGRPAVRLHRSGSVELHLSGDNRGLQDSYTSTSDFRNRSMRSITSVEEEAATTQRVRKLEELVSQARVANERLQREVAQATSDRDRALLELERAQTDRGIVTEEMVTERTQREAIRDAMEKAQRDREAAMREQRAAERRHQGVMEEMRQLLEDRDRVNRLREAAVRERGEMQRVVEQLENELGKIRRERDALIDAQKSVDGEKEELLSRLQSEKRMHASSSQDLEVVKQQLDAVVNERDMAIKEQEMAMRRVDEIMKDKRNALRARDEALKSLEEATDRCMAAEASQQRAEKQFGDLRSQLEFVEAQVAQVQDKARDWQKRCQEALTEKENAEDGEQKACQDLEAAQRQVRALESEMKNLIRVRDLALKQRDSALEEADDYQSELAASRASFADVRNNRDASLDLPDDEHLSSSRARGSSFSSANERDSHAVLMRSRHVPVASPGGRGMLDVHQELQRSNDKLLAENESLLEEIQTRRQEFQASEKALKHELDVCSSRLAETKSMYQQVLTKCDSLQEERRKLQSDLVTLRQSNQQLEQVADDQVNQTEDIVQKSREKSVALEFSLQQLRDEVGSGVNDLSLAAKVASSLLHELESELHATGEMKRGRPRSASEIDSEVDRSSLAGSLVSLQDLNGSVHRYSVSVPHTPTSSLNRLMSPSRYSVASTNAASLGVEVREASRVMRTQLQDIQALLKVFFKRIQELKEEIVSSNRHGNRLKDEMRVIHEETEALNDQKAVLQKRIDSIADMKEDAELEINELRKKNESLRSQLESVVEEKEELSQDLERVNQSKEQFCESERNARMMVEKYSAEIRELNTNNDRLKSRLEEAVQVQRQLESILEDERHRTQQVESASREVEKQVRSKQSEVVKELEAARTEARTQKLFVEELEERIKMNTDAWDRERTSLERERDATLQELYDVSGKLTKLRLEQNNTDSAVHELEMERDDLKNQLEELKVKTIRLKPLEQEVESLRSELGRTQRRHADALTDLENLQDVQEKLATRTDELRSMEVSRNSVMRKNEQLEERLERMSERLKEASESATRRNLVSNSRSDSELRLVSNQLQSVNLQLDSTRLQESALRDENDRLVREIDEVQENLRITRDELINTKQKVNHLEKALDRLGHGNGQVHLSQSQLASEVDSATRQLNRVSAEKRHVTKELEEVYSSLAELQSQLSSSRAENRQLRSSGYQESPAFKSSTFVERNGQRGSNFQSEATEFDHRGRRDGSNFQSEATEFDHRGRRDRSNFQSEATEFDHRGRRDDSKSQAGGRKDSQRVGRLDLGDLDVEGAQAERVEGLKGLHDASGIGSPVSVHVGRSGDIVITRSGLGESSHVSSSVANGAHNGGNDDTESLDSNKRNTNRRYVYDLHGRRRLASDASMNSYYR